MRTVRNIKELKENNARRILNQIRVERAVIKSSLARTLNLSFATISNICSELAENGFILIEETAESTGGRKPVTVRFNPTAKYILAFDFGDALSFEMSLIDLDYNIIKHQEISLSKISSLEPVLELIHKTYTQFLSESNIPATKVIGAGAAVPGFVDKKKNMVVLSSNELFNNVYLKEKLEDLLSMPVSVENDADMAALYQSISFNKKMQNLLFLHFSRGITLGMIIDGKIYRGAGGLSGEIGHISISDNRTVCECGKTGCFEAAASLPNMLKMYYKNKYSKDEILNDFVKLLNSFIENYKENEKEAVKVVDTVSRAIGVVIGLLIDILNPQMVALGGSLTPLFKLSIKDIREHARESSSIAKNMKTDIVNVVDEKFGITRGCGEVVFQDWLLK
ncbi:MAG: ROK family protein [Spirochaetota bacterium]